MTSGPLVCLAIRSSITTAALSRLDLIGDACIAIVWRGLDTTFATTTTSEFADGKAAHPRLFSRPALLPLTPLLARIHQPGSGNGHFQHLAERPRLLSHSGKPGLALPA